MHHSLLSTLLLSSSLLAQALTVDYPDSVLGSPAGQYPVYTGTGTNVIRGQLFCPSTFAGLPTMPMLCTRVGIQLAEVTGPVLYSQFEVRIGTTTVPALTNTWLTNLPNQTLQVDLSNTVITGGQGVNQWVEWPLAVPFLYTPGEGVVLDMITQTSVAGQYLRTAIGSGVPRLIAASYAGLPTGPTLATSGGIKFRMVFENGGFAVTTPGCPGTGQVIPVISAFGQPTIGNLGFAIMLDQALPATLCALTIGFPAFVDIGGGCILRNDALGLFLVPSNLSGQAGYAFPIPNQAWLAGTVFDTQWAVLDGGSASPLAIALSGGAKMFVQ